MAGCARRRFDCLCWRAVPAEARKGIGGYRIMVIILPCQGRDTGSIPVTRSKFKTHPFWVRFKFGVVVGNRTGCERDMSGGGSRSE